jgi:hypothetical protein
MAVELKPGVRYDMPAAFGPSAAISVTSGYTVLSAAIPFVTEHDAVADLLPRWFRPTARPVVTVNYQRCLGMDWMGGRDYNIVSVYVAVESVGIDPPVSAPYGLVIWESDAAPVVSGREYMGTPKLHAKIPDVEMPAASAEFHCAEYEARLMTGRIEKMERVVDPDELATFQRAGESICRLHWKYIPGLRGAEPDADYPVAMYTSARYTEFWRGEGEFELGAPGLDEAPYSAKIVAALAALPVVGMRPAVAAKAVDVQLYRDRTERIDR